MQKPTNKKLGLWMLTALVAGNMVGSGIFLLPSSLATIGSISIFSFCFTSLGAFLLAIVFSKMSSLVPKTGGPYIYARTGFGNFIGFQIAYSYWLYLWIGNAAVVVAMLGYLAVFWPILHQPLPGCIVGIIVVWSLTLVNISGMRSVGILQIITTIIKYIPLASIAILGWWHFHPHFITQSFNVSGRSNFSALSNAATLTLWAFVGVESATIPAGSVDNPRRNIPLATLLGTIIAVVIYVSSSTAIMGMIPAHILATSTSPFAAAADIIFGHWGKWLIAAGAVISCFGCLNGWILLQGQVPMAAAENNLFPQVFGKRNKYEVPARGLIITSALLTSLLLIITSKPNLVAQFHLLILIATFAALIPYFYTAMAEIIVIKQQSNARNKKLHITIALFAALYSYWALFGAGAKIIFYTSMLIFTSVPLYAWIYRRQQN
jgi:APA family basic amino acid/polyamine antiporter